MKMGLSTTQAQVELVSTGLFVITASLYLYLDVTKPRRRLLLRRRQGQEEEDNNIKNGYEQASTSSSSSSQNNRTKKHIVIVGAGISGLTAARSLLLSSEESSQQPHLNNYKITIVEATNRVGGRIQATTDFCDGVNLDLGAEYIHCSGTILTDWIKNEFSTSLSQEENWEHVFVTAHADGGPDKHPTRDGKYGMFYVDETLFMYNDDAVKPVEDSLHEILDQNYQDINPTMSVADALAPYKLSPSLFRLAIAGYGNTAGCTDMSKLSLSMLQFFEHHWETNEIEGDYRLSEGMYSIISTLLADLKKLGGENFELLLDWPVDIVKEEQDTTQTTTDGSDSNRKDRVVMLTNQNDPTKQIKADGAIVAVPPPFVAKMVPDLSEKQQTALKFIGFDTAIKVMLKFNQRPWPEKLFNVVCADGPIPEIWFRDFPCDQYVMVNYLISDMALDFLERINSDHNDGKRRLDRATEICLQQLSEMLKKPIEYLKCIHVQTLIHDWKNDEPYIGGGYMYPKVGLEPHHLQALAAPIGSSHRIFLAGEATNTNACCTVQAAMETGVRAARHVQNLLR